MFPSTVLGKIIATYLPTLLAGFLLTFLLTGFLQNAASADPPSAVGGVTIESGFECSQKMDVTKIDDLHFSVKSAQKVSTGGFYLLLRVVGAKGKTVQIDLEGSPFTKWGKSVPQYCHTSSLSDLKVFESIVPSKIGPPLDEESGPSLPDTKGQQWHFIADTTQADGKIFLKQKFEEDSAYIAFRVPYTPSYNIEYLNSLKDNPNVSVEMIGKSAGGHDLQVVCIPPRKAQPLSADLKKPCVLVYAREHPDEQDCSWVAQGMVNFLISDDPQAVKLRASFNFYIIPLLDPDGALIVKHEHITNGFAPGSETAETIVYAGWLQGRINAGARLYLVLNLHNPPPGSAFNLACPEMMARSEYQKFWREFHQLVRNQCTDFGFTVRKTPWRTGTSAARFAGWCSESFGALEVPYETNSLTPQSQLTLGELRSLGVKVLMGAGEFLGSEVGAKTLTAQIDEALQMRQQAWQKFRSANYSKNPIEEEFYCRKSGVARDPDIGR